ncbi:MAG TPA: hypothetical protein VJT71_20900 [Pyrinomonadaceae bacterium]|nr:hypothetical protein [Pyrinomonadaceae bacterium]
MEMGDMEMGTEVSPDSKNDSNAQPLQVALTPESSSDQVALDLPVEQCAHCWTHSQPTSSTVSVAAVDPSKQMVDTNPPSADFAVALPSTFPISITPSEHSPPGISLPRHVLISVFRI